MWAGIPLGGAVVYAGLALLAFKYWRSGFLQASERLRWNLGSHAWGYSTLLYVAAAGSAGEAISETASILRQQLNGSRAAQFLRLRRSRCCTFCPICWCDAFRR